MYFKDCLDLTTDDWIEVSPNAQFDFGRAGFALFDTKGKYTTDCMSNLDATRQYLKVAL